MADERTRIINLPEATSLNSSMNFLEDSADGSGTRRVTFDKLKGAINQANAENLAPAYSNAATYNVGDLCTYQGKLYCCNTQISTAEDWTPAHWTATNIASQREYVVPNITSALASKSANIIVTSNDSSYGDGGVCVFDVLDYAIRKGYAKDDGSRIFPVPSINAPVQRDIPKREILAVVKSYTDRTDLLYGDVDVPASDPKPGNLFAETVDVDGSGNHYINCVAFVGAIVKGIKYERSRYAISTNVDGEYSAYRAMPQSDSQYYTQGWLNTFELAQYFAEQKQLYYTDSDTKTAASRLQFGDVLFMQTDSSPYDNRYLKLSHAMIVLGVIPNSPRVIVAECTSTEESYFGESGGKPYINIRALSSRYIVFARPTYNLPYSENPLYKISTGFALHPYMLMGATINVDGDSDATQRGYIFGVSTGIAANRDYITVSSGDVLNYTGTLSDDGNLHIVRAILYDANLNYTRRANLAYNGSASGVTVAEGEKYVRFMFQVAPSSYVSRRSLKLSDVYNFEVKIS